MQEVILYMAISVDGFIARHNDETPWSDAEFAAFGEFVKTCDVIVLGRRTYEIMSSSEAFIDGPEYVVATNDQSADTGTFRKLSIRTEQDLPRARKIGVIGGGDLNGRLAELGVIDTVILDVEPIVLGEGKRLFGEHEVELPLELESTRIIGDSTMQTRYRVRYD